MGFSTCWKCKSQFWMPDDLEAVARRDGVTAVYCAHGHAAWFKGKNVEEEMRLERDRLKQRLAEKDDEIARQQQMREAAERRASASRGQITKIKNRVGNGVCPCCNRTFTNLSRHMHSKHPAYIKTDETEARVQ